MRKKIMAFVFAAALLMALAVPLFGGGVGTASAHVHGITPLLGLGCNVNNAITGANATDGGAAAIVNGGPITGLIPRDTGNGNVTVTDGGFGATTANC